jgi:hypothetical protein
MIAMISNSNDIRDILLFYISQQVNVKNIRNIYKRLKIENPDLTKDVIIMKMLRAELEKFKAYARNRNIPIDFKQNNGIIRKYLLDSLELS